MMLRPIRLSGRTTPTDLTALHRATRRELVHRGLTPEHLLEKQLFSGGDDLPEFVSRIEFHALVMRRGYRNAVAIIRARQELEAIEQGVRAARATGSTLPLLQASHMDELGDAYRQHAQDTTRGAYLRGARLGSDALRAHRVDVRFDVVNPEAVAYARRASGALITAIDESQREAVRVLAESAVSGERTVQELARDVRDIVGLRPDQVRTLAQYRERLAARDLTADEVERKLRRYADALLRQRGELIARTEILKAANEGQLALWREAKQAGQLEGLRKIWVTTPDELLCPHCEPLDGVAVGLTDAWDSEIGSVSTPPLHPNCRCTMGLTRPDGE